MKKLLIILMFATAGVQAQTVKMLPDGNLVQVTSERRTAEATGKTYTDAKGKQYPVYRGSRGSLFIVRVSKSGKQYKQYLKP